jgi:hypothetical protein
MNLHSAKREVNAERVVVDKSPFHSPKCWLESVFESFEQMDSECAHRGPDNEDQRPEPAQAVIGLAEND